MTIRIAPLFLLLIVLVAACSPAAEEATAAPTAEDVATEEAPAEEAATEEMSDEDMTEEADAADDEAAAPAEAEAVAVAYNGPEWTGIPLVNARTGATFTLADFAGKTVFVEPMATWCSNCRAQQSQVAAAMEQLDEEQFVFISLSVEGGFVTDGDLASYADRNGFPQVFVVASDELLTLLVSEFGRGVTNAPSTPHFIISPDGTVSELSTGRHSPDAIIAQVNAAANS